MSYKVLEDELNRKFKFMPLVLAMLALVAIFAAACGDDGDNPTVTATATEQTQQITIDDPRIQSLVDMVREGEINNGTELENAAFRLGFTADQVDQVINVLSVHTGLNLAVASPSASPSGTAKATESATATATATTTPPPDTSDAFEKRVLTSKGSIPNLPNDLSHDGWAIHVADTALDPNQDGLVGENLKKLEVPNPSEWKYFPNVPNPDRPDFPTSAEKPAPWGAEYGEDEAPFCENHPCDYVVSAQSYRYSSGDQSILGTQCPPADKSIGCIRLVINVMDETVILRDQDVDNGFTVTGRYWDGTHLEWAILGIVSHGAANMLGMETYSKMGEKLNFGTDENNAGSNCGTPRACDSVDVLVIYIAGDRVLATAHTVVTADSGKLNQ